MKTINKKNQEGQILLLIVMLLATVLTIVITVSFTSRTETQVTKIQEDADKALAGAESGIEAAIGANVGSNLTFTSLFPTPLQGINASQSTVSVTAASGDFVSPLISKDDQYTIYLATYNSDGTFGSSYSGATVRLYYGTETANTCDNIALETTIISGSTPYTVKRYKADKNNILGSSTTAKVTVYSDVNYSLTAKDGTSYIFKCRADVNPIPVNSKLMFVRIIATGATETRIGYQEVGMPSQGKYITSEAKTNSGATKKVQLFQSNPQLPANLFVTTFEPD